MKRMGDRVIFIIKNKIRFLAYVILFLLTVGKNLTEFSNRS